MVGSLTAASILNTVAKAVDKRRQGENGPTDRQRVTLIGSQEASTTTTTTTRVPCATTMRKITVSKITTTNNRPPKITATTFDDAIEADSAAG